MSKALSTSVQQQLAQQRESAAQRLAGLSGGEAMQFIKGKAGKWRLPDGTAIAGEIPVVVLDWAFHFSYWSGPYDPTNNTPPDCVAVGTTMSQMQPSKNSINIQNDGGPCATCEWNQFGSGGGNRKACKNTIMLAVMRFDEETEDDTIYYISVPPSALRNWTDYCTKLSERGMAPVEVVTVIGFDGNVDYVKPIFSADRNLTKEYRQEDEEGASYFVSYADNMQKATEALLREPTFRTEDG